MTDIAGNFTAIQKRISGRASLVAVSKSQPDEKIDALLHRGQRIFGENRVQEAKTHWVERRKSYSDLELHLIGPLQSNKIRDAVALFDVIQTLDRKSLIDAVAKEAARQQKTLRFFIQVNIGAEIQKSGVSIAELPALLIHARDAGLSVEGLMCIPPDGDASGLYFALLKKLADRHGLKNLSMGMSADYERAVLAGATHVRIGGALFGDR